jgi:hypothetical protein
VRFMLRHTISVLLLAYCLGGYESRAQTVLPIPPAPPSSTATLANHLVAGLFPNDAVVPSSPSFSITVRFLRPPKAQDPESYLRFLEGSVEAAVRQRGWIGERLAQAKSPDYEVRVELKFHKRHLVATAELIRAPENIWERLRLPLGGGVGTASANVPVDLEIRSVLGLKESSINTNRLRLKNLNLESDKGLLSAPVLAIHVQDLNGDRMPEVAFLQRDNLRVVRHSKHGFKDVLAEFRFNARPSRAKVRDPVASLVPMVDPKGRPLLIAATSDYSEPVALGFSSGALVRLPMRVGQGAWPLYALGVERLAGTEWPEGSDVHPGGIHELGLRDGTAMMTQSGMDEAYRVQLFGHSSVVASAMTSTHVSVVDLANRVVWAPQIARVTKNYDVFVESPQGIQTLPMRHGSVICVADLNQDGRPEILATGTAIGDTDTLTLYGQRAGAYVALWTLRGIPPVTALAYGDVNRDGRGEFLVASSAGQKASIGLIEVHLTL